MIGYFWHSLRSRLMYNLMPISSFYFFGIPDSIIYRRIIGQSVFASTEHVLNVARQLAVQDNSQSALSLLNYGVLTVSHLIPGFVSFLGTRFFGWILFGPTIHRKHQEQRRTQVITYNDLVQYCVKIIICFCSHAIYTDC